MGGVMDIVLVLVVGVGGLWAYQQGYFNNLLQPPAAPAAAAPAPVAAAPEPVAAPAAPDNNCHGTCGYDQENEWWCCNATQQGAVGGNSFEALSLGSTDVFDQYFTGASSKKNNDKFTSAGSNCHADHATALAMACSGGKIKQSPLVKATERNKDKIKCEDTGGKWIKAKGDSEPFCCPSAADCNTLADAVVAGKKNKTPGPIASVPGQHGWDSPADVPDVEAQLLSGQDPNIDWSKIKPQEKAASEKRAADFQQNKFGTLGGLSEIYGEEGAYYGVNVSI